MVKLPIYQLIIFFTLILVKPVSGFAGERLLADTVPDLKKPVPELPDVKKVVEQPLDVKKLDVIKEVPKSRRKMKPIAIPAPVPVKPIRIIKPKIIRRVI